MKGFYIFEEEFVKGTVDCFEIGNIDHTFTHQIDFGTLSEEVKMHALVSKGTKTKCSPDDTYDFKTGALISLMKMCGVDKVVRACNEAFSEERYNTYIAKLEGKLHDLKKDFDKVRDLKDFYKKNYEDVKEHYDKLGDRNKYLIDDINKKLEYIKEKDEEIEKLKSDKDKTWKNYQRKIQKKQDRINELNNIEEGYIKLREEYDSLFEENEKLQHEYNLCLNSENALKYTVDSLNKSVDKLNKAIVGYKNDLYNTAKRCKELERGYKASNDDEAKLVEYYQREIKKLEAENEKLKDELRLKEDAINEWKQTLRERNEKIGDLVCENYKLKTDCEKLQHGYVYTDMMICGGRQNGKQYTFLVDLFKKTDQKKVDAAYKEAYDTTLPIWQKEVLNQMYGVYKESKEKTEPPRTLDINGTTYRKEISLKDLSKIFCPEELKVPTKREKMWENILKEGRTPVYVKREDVHDFLEECQIAGIKWQSGKMPLETTPFHMSERYDGVYFFIMTSLDISKTLFTAKQVIKEFRHVMTWWGTAYPEEVEAAIHYIRPMRWDLFKKGRLAVKVNYNNYKEFYEACEKELGKKPMTIYAGEYTVSICKKDGKFEVFTIEDQKSTGRKIVDWEDVRENKTTTEDPYDTWKW